MLLQRIGKNLIRINSKKKIFLIQNYRLSNLIEKKANILNQNELINEKYIINKNYESKKDIMGNFSKNKNFNNLQNDKKLEYDELKRNGFFVNFIQRITDTIEQISKIDEVRKAQNDVMEIKDDLRQAGDQKRQVLQEIRALRHDLQIITNEIGITNRGTERFMSLAQKETDVMKLERIKQADFDNYDELERRLFNKLTMAINNSYEKERIHSNVIRLLGWFASGFFALLSLITTITGYYYHNKKMKEALNENITQAVHKEFISLEKSFAKRFGFNQNQNQGGGAGGGGGGGESWSNFFWRHSVSTYRWFVPKKPS